METNYSKDEEVKEQKLIGESKALTRIQYKTILRQQENSLCQITIRKKNKNIKATCFLCKIPDPVLITNNHVLDEEDLKPGEEINIYFTDENENKHFKTIKIDENRNFCTINKNFYFRLF